MELEFGWCTGIGDAEMVRASGYDFIECAVTSLSPWDDEGLEERLEAFRRSPLPLTAWNILFPGHMKLVGPEADMGAIKAYIHKVVGILAPLGAKRVVFGSGGPRRVPEGWDTGAAREQLMRVLGFMADATAGTELVFVLEPLNRKECNMVNSVAEAVGMVAELDRPGVRALADFYHMDEEGEPTSALVDAGGWLAHIHLADTGRRAPGTGSYPYDDFLRDLMATGYKGTVSMECRSDDPATEAPLSLEFLRNKLRNMQAR